MMAMKTDIEKRVAEIITGGQGLPVPMREVLNILVHFNGAAWKSELIQELNIGEGSGEKEKISGWVDHAIKNMQDAGLVRVEQMIKATESKEGAKDELVSLVHLAATAAALSKLGKPTPKKRKR